MDNLRIAKELRILANALDLAGENRFKVKAYRTAADSVLGLPVQLSSMLASGDDLTAIPGIGKGIAAILAELVGTGKVAQLSAIVANLTPIQRAALSAGDRDVKKTVQAMERLGVDSIDAMREKLAEPESRSRLGRQLERHVRFGFERRRSVLLPVAEELASASIDLLGSTGHGGHLEIAGEIRRRTETVSTISIVSIGGSFGKLVESCSRLPSVESTLEVSPERALFAHGGGPMLELFAGEAARRGQVMISATGSAAHVGQLEAALGTKLTQIRERLESEEDVYRLAGLALVPPELREGRGEIEAARRNALPQLVSIADLKGDLHCHSDWSDGIDSLESLAAAAATRGYEYLAVTDHSARLKI